MLEQMIQKFSLGNWVTLAIGLLGWLLFAFTVVIAWLIIKGNNQIIEKQQTQKETDREKKLELLKVVGNLSGRNTFLEKMIERQREAIETRDMTIAEYKKQLGEAAATINVIAEEMRFPIIQQLNAEQSEYAARLDKLVERINQ